MNQLPQMKMTRVLSMNAENRISQKDNKHDTGTTKEMRASFESFLKKENYIVAPITIDTDDWKFNQLLCYGRFA